MRLRIKKKNKNIHDIREKHPHTKEFDRFTPDIVPRLDT